MKNMIKKSSLIIMVSASVWIIFGQSCMKMRTSDPEAIKDFNDVGLKLQLSDKIEDGRTLHYASVGDSSKPTLFFIHGSPGSWGAFKKYMKDTGLLRYFRIVSIDRPGFGYSDYGKATDLTHQSQLIGSLIKQLQNGKSFYIIGHSLGGPLAVKLASHYAQYISGMVLLAASVDPAEEKPERWRPVMRAFPLRYLLPGAFRPSNIELWKFKKDVLTMPDDLANITCPVIIVQGLQDPLVPPGNAIYAQKQLIKAESVTMMPIPDANHFIPWTRYDSIKKALMSLPH